ncbi:MAG: hypothetical protein WDN27_01535 [Candidatus Saccharibacteria bacterium]
MNAHVSTLLEKEVSRKEFLGMSALAVASIFGFGTLIKLLTGKSLEGSHGLSGGYGSSAYGGSKESR